METSYTQIQLVENALDKGFRVIARQGGSLFWFVDGICSEAQQGFFSVWLRSPGDTACQKVLCAEDDYQFTVCESK